MSADRQRYEHELAPHPALAEHILDALPPPPNQTPRIFQCSLARVDEAAARATARSLAQLHGQMPIRRKPPHFARGRRCV